MTSAASRTPGSSHAATLTSALSGRAAGASAASASAGQHFASLLSQQPATTASPSPSTATSTATSTSDSAARQRASARRADNAPPPPTAARRSESAPPPKQAAATATPAAAPAAKHPTPADPPQEERRPSVDTPQDQPPKDAEAATATASTDDAKTASDETPTPADPMLAAWLQWPATAAATRATADADAASQDTGVDAAAETPGRLAPATETLATSTTEGPQSAASTDPARDLPAQAAAWMATLNSDTETVGSGQADTHKDSALSITPTGHGPAAAWSGATAPQTAAAPATTVALGTAPGQPDFAETVSMHLSQLAKDGQHEATLTLNPAEMGSIAVRIAIDGSQTQVDFAASSAQTRELLQAHLGDLARALQDAGLQMTGGGVRDQSAGPPSGGSAQALGRSGGDTDDTGPGETLRVRLPAAAAGRLDLFA